ncbi:CYFA0S01e17590g1_1 [Cyberlindnera fabianii]|uniref:Mediator of RNA polymerase II transcription subunit 19 n=1 Tax=Cyberlindnera fabianii TaxID=36022 RepID=A0A061AJR5_CYBFA|nr:CYFA0S01e17590g1_1 [Cyberlindnera fabianii]
MTQPIEGAPESYYYVDSSKYYTKSAPHPTQNLIEVYNLTAISDSVARLSEDGTKGVKLRKSYKAHVNDLPGRHTNLPKEHTISPIVFAPQEGPGRTIERFEPKMLSYNISFDKTPDSGIPGFDAADLAIGDSSQGTKRKSKNKTDDNTKRRRLD